MAARIFSDTLANLNSEKLKDRTQGLDDVRLFLSVPRNIEWINQDKKQWLKFLQSIFQIVVDEQKAYVKKSTTPALKRLKDAAQAVRLIIERAAPDIPRKAFKAVFNHILSIIVVRTQLFEPVALDYLKALKSIVQYQPHLDHLDVRQWTQAMATCFSAILGDPIRGYELVDDHAFSSESDEDQGTSTQRSKKRKATGLMRAFSEEPEDMPSGQKIGASRLASQDIIELAGCINQFFKSSHAPLLANGSALLSKFVRFFQTFTGETTAHLPILTAFSRLLSELDLNCKDLLQRAVVHIWPKLITLWPSKNVAVKEQLVMIATSLLPYIEAQEGFNRSDALRDMYNICLIDVENRWGIEVLDLHCLLLVCRSAEQRDAPPAFSNATIQAGPAFDFPQALSWAVIHLCASCLSCLRHEVPNTATEAATPSRDRKRAKLDDPFDKLLDEMASCTTKSLVYRLQLLLFLSHLDPTLASQPISPPSAVVQMNLLSHSEEAVQAWAMILLAASARHLSATLDTSMDKASVQGTFWTRIWEKAIRKQYSPATSRAACYLLVEMSYSKLLPMNRIQHDLIEAAREIEIQGPYGPTEAACALLSRILELSRSDMRACRIDIVGKISNRVTNHWQMLPRSGKGIRSFTTRATFEPINVQSLLALLLFLAFGWQGTSEELVANAPDLLPDASLVYFWQARHGAEPLRQWFWSASLSSALEPDQQRSQLPSAGVDHQEPHVNTIAVRILAYLRAHLETLHEELEDTDEVAWAAFTLDRLRRMIDLTCLTLAFETFTGLANVIQPEQSPSRALGILNLVLPRLLQSRWTLSERASLLSALSPVFLPAGMPASPRPDILVNASKTSGTRRHLLLNQGAALIRTNTPLLLERMWHTHAMQDMFSRHSKVFRHFVYSSEEAQQTAEGDIDFGPIRVTSSTQMTGRAMLDPGATLASHSCVEVAIRALVTTGYYEEGQPKPPVLRSLVRSLLNDTGTHLVHVGGHLLAAFQSGYLNLRSNDIEDLLTKVGELLPAYEYSRDESMQLFVVHLLSATVREWGKKEHLEATYFTMARKLAVWLAGQLQTQNLSSWRIRGAILDLLGSFVRQPDLSFSVLSEDPEQVSGESAAPETLLVQLLDDPDYRVRFKLCSIVGHLCARLHAEGKQSFSFWTTITDSKSFDLEGRDFENNITLLLAYTNIMIASDFFRSSAYTSIILLAAMNASIPTARFVKSALTATASRLGLASLADLYTFLAPYTMAEQLYHAREKLMIPDSTAFGFVSKQALYRTRFAETAPMVLAGPRPEFFHDLCAYVGSDERDCLAAIFPTYVAYKFTGAEPGSNDFGLAEQDVAIKAINIAQLNGQGGPEYLNSIRDLVVWRLFSFIWEGEYTLPKLVVTMRNCWPDHATSCKVLTSILAGFLNTFRPNVLSPPDVSLEHTLKTVKNTNAAVRRSMDEEAIVYSVLHRLLCSAAEPPFLSQQLRLLYNTVICLACAAHVVTVSHPTLVMIMQRTAVLMQQVDLFPLASSIFRWSCERRLDLTSKQNGTMKEEAHYILLAAESAISFKDDADDSVQQAAQVLLAFLKASVMGFSQSSDQAICQVGKSLCILWPENLLSRNSTVTIRSVEIAFEFARTERALCRGLTSLAAHLATSMLPHTQTALAKLLGRFLQGSDPSAITASFKTEDVTAFGDLLFMSGGCILPQGLEDIPTRGALLPTLSVTVKEPLLRYLEQLLEVTDLRVVEQGFEALHAIAAVQQGIEGASETSARLSIISAHQTRRYPTLTTEVSDSVEADDLLQQGSALDSKRPSRATWQCSYATTLAKFLSKTDPFFANMQSLFLDKSNLAKDCLPHLVLALLLSSQDNIDGCARTSVSQYFEKHLDQLGPGAMDIVQLVLWLRAYDKPCDAGQPQPALSRDLWLSVPYIKLARTSITYQAYHAALLCVELAHEHGHIEETMQRNMLYEIYTHLDEPDSFYSVRATNLADGLIRRLHHESRWLDALSWHGAELESSGETRQSGQAMTGVLECMARSDLGVLAMTLLRAEDAAATNPFRTLPDLAWKTGSWDIPTTDEQGKGVHLDLFRILRESSISAAPAKAEKLARDCLLRNISVLAHMDQLSPSLNERCLGEMLAAREAYHWHQDKARCLSLYKDTANLDAFSRDASELIFNVRAKLLGGFREAEARLTIGDEPSVLGKQAIDAERATLLALSDLAQKQDSAQVALNSVMKCQHLGQPIDFRTTLAIASVYWMKSQSFEAVQLLRDMLRDSTVTLKQVEKAQALSMIGTWVATARLENAPTIRQRYFEPAWHQVASCAASEAAPIALRYARFADEQYQQTSQHVAEIDQLDSYSRRKQAEVHQLVKQSKASQNHSSDLHSRHRVAVALSEQDRHIVDSFRESRTSLLQGALCMYGHALACTDNDEDCIFRLCSLWLENFDNDSIFEIARQSIEKIPSHRFVALVPQLSARLANLSDVETSFRTTLSLLVERIAREHPFHTLFQLFFLYNSGAGLNSQRRKSASSESTSRQRRLSPIGSILERLRLRKETTAILMSIDRAIEAYSQWASEHIDKRSGGKIRTIPPNMKLFTLQNLPIPVSTLPIPIDKTCKYQSSNMPCIVGYKNTYLTAGGVNLPKITDCVASDGKIYRQLFKGGDDVRQDAVMQQVFGVANNLLASDNRTSARKLAVRTYKVIPLTSDCGLLEFVRNSQAIGEWLLAAHAKYNPDDLPVQDARKSLAEKIKAPAADRIELYKKIIQRIHPVMRHFFTEKHHVPYWWFEMRLNYSRSTAVMSMVGYLMGLGDRHVSNIMIDTAKGGLVPIDFGIAFEAGKQLPTPEHVPFRLTPDIVDGFGISGVEGVFRKCSEETIRVLRSKSSVLMTILEVFKYDPLQKWSASASKIKRVQGSQAMERSHENSSRAEELTDADRAIRTVAEKLKTDLSVEYTVNDLILQARDAANLGTIFHGWQP